jgi:repressor LexA
MMGLTRRQRECLAAVRDYQTEHGAMPTLDELKDMLGIKYRSGVFRLLAGLEQRGALKRLHGGQRGIKLMSCPNCGQELRRPPG